MKKCRRFQFITDTRFGETRKDIMAMDKKLKKSGVVIVSEGSVRELSFMRDEIPKIDRGKQWRKTYVVDKGKKDKNWNDVYGKVNKIKPVRYKSVNC